MARRRQVPAGGGGALVGAAATLGLLASRPSRGAAKALLLLLEILPSGVTPLRRLTPEPLTTPMELPFGPADLYRRRGRRDPGIVLVHGANPGGRADPRVRMMATTLARLGRTVLVPGLAMGEHRIERDDTRRIRSAIAYLAGLTGERVVVLAFSFGAAFTLVALEEEPDAQDQVRALATVGTYYDLVHMLEGVTTGQVNYDDGMVDWQPSGDAPRAVTEFLSLFLEAEDSEALMKAYDAGDPTLLGRDPLAVYSVMTNRDPRLTRELVRSLPQDLVDLFDTLSPSTHISRIRVPVWALHSHEDPAAPPTESLRLVRALESRVDARLTLVGVLRHVTLSEDIGVWAREGRALLRYAARLLKAQEPVLPRH